MRARKGVMVAAVTFLWILLYSFLPLKTGEALAAQKAVKSATSYTFVYHRNATAKSYDKTYTLTVRPYTDASTTYNYLAWPGGTWTRKGYMLEGWSASKNAKTATWSVNQNYKESFCKKNANQKREIHLYAVWTKYPSKSILFMGDSYVPNGHWPYYVAKKIGLTTDSGEMCGAFAQNWMLGAGFSRSATRTRMDGKGTQKVDFQQLLTEAKSTFYWSDRRKIRYIVIAAGYNDVSSTHFGESGEKYLKAKMRIFFRTARSLFPNAKILIANVGRNSENKDINRRLLTVTDIYKSVAAEFSYVTYMTKASDPLKGKSSIAFKTDTIHPNKTGGRIIANKVALYLK